MNYLSNKLNTTEHIYFILRKKKVVILKYHSADGKVFATFLQTELDFFGNKFLKNYRHQIYTTEQMKWFD